MTRRKLLRLESAWSASLQLSVLQRTATRSSVSQEAILRTAGFIPLPSYSR
jgi:hypothetical protein